MKTDGLFRDSKLSNSAHHSQIGNTGTHLTLSNSDLLNTTVRLDNLANRSSLIRKLNELLTSFLVQVFLFAIILLSILLLCVDTYADMRRSYQKWLMALDTLCLFIFTVEFMCKLAIMRQLYFKDLWNLIDFLTIIASLIDLTANALTMAYIKKSLDPIEKLNVLSMVKHLKMFRTLRAFKSLRVLRTIKLLSSLEIILDTCINSFQSLRAIFILMTIILYNFSIVSTSLFHSIDQKRFGNLGESAFTLFQVITLDDWYIIYKSNSFNASNNENRTSLEHFSKQYFLVGFLMSFLILENFIMLNLFVAVLVDNFHQAREARDALKTRNTNLVLKVSRVHTLEKKDSSVRRIQVSAVLQRFLAKFRPDVDFNERVKFYMKKPLFKLRKTFKNRPHLRFNKFKFNREIMLLVRRKHLSPRNANTNNSNDSTDSVLFEHEYYNDRLNESSSNDSDPDEFKENFAKKLPSKQKTLLERHFQLLATIEYYSSQMSELYAVLENLVQITDTNDVS